MSMTPALDYALMMLSCYTNDEPLNIEAIRHYRQLAADERVKIDRERELIELVEYEQELDKLSMNITQHR